MGEFRARREGGYWGIAALGAGEIGGVVFAGVGYEEMGGTSMTNPNNTAARREFARRAFSQRMKAAGWKRLPAGGFGWIHRESGTTWEGENYTTDQGIAWEWYHERGELPPATGGAKL